MPWTDYVSHGGEKQRACRQATARHSLSGGRRLYATSRRLYPGGACRPAQCAMATAAGACSVFGVSPSRRGETPPLVAGRMSRRLYATSRRLYATSRRLYATSRRLYAGGACRPAQCAMASPAGVCSVFGVSASPAGVKPRRLGEPRWCRPRCKRRQKTARLELQDSGQLLHYKT